MPHSRLIPVAPRARPLLQPSIDENLLIDATQRWQDCRRDLLTLMAGIPTVRSCINRLLEEHLQLDGERIGLEFAATPQRGRSRITLTEACLYMQQHPTLDTAQLPAASILYLPVQHALALYTPAMLLDELKTLELDQAIDDNWLRYWRTERAPNTPVTCLARANELYRAHFEASAEHWLAEGKVNPEVLAPLFALINPAQGTTAAQKICVEQVLLRPAGGQAIPLPGAWVLTLDAETPVNQLLYLPTQAPGWRTFTRRTSMERWLLERQSTLFGTRAFDPLATIEYRIKHNPLDDGISLWLKQLNEQQYQDAITPLPALDLENASLARLHIDQLDTRRQAQSLFALAPERAAPAHTDPAFGQFGLLHNGIDASQRDALVNQQRHALEKLLGNDAPTSPRWLSFRQQLEALKVQQQAAEAAARAMLNRRPLDLDSLNTHYTALYQARLQGLRIEAQIQHRLDQISAEELQWIESALQTPEPDVVTLTLSVTQPGNAAAIRTELKGPLVLLPPQDPQTPTTRDGVHFIYWPGSGGALQRFTSKQALQEGLFSIHPEDDQLALDFTPLSQDPFNYSLSSQQAAFEEQAAQIRQTWPAPEQASRLDDELQKLREQTLPGLLIPNNSAREAAHLQLIEQYNSQLLADQVQPWLRTQTGEKHEALKGLLSAYAPASRHSQALFERSLPPREVFVGQQLEARLRKDFSLEKGFTLLLELPDSVEQKRDIVAGAAPSTPVKIIDVPSKARSKMSLDELALRNIGADISPRLGFVSVEVTADDPNEHDILKVGVTKGYLASMVTDLNLAKKYEDLIVQAFKGTPGESLHQKQYRRECLIEPLLLMLKAQGMLGLMQNHIDATQLQVLETAIDAHTHEAWDAGGKRIRLLPAHLSAGGKDTQDQSPVTLSGITFIEEQGSGNTLLYLPDTPDERYLRGYASLELARIGLFELCRLDSMVEYVAGRAIKGDVRAHIRRIDQATSKGYNAMIQAGLPWPATTSLAAHQLDAHMGRLIEAHRNDARSNDDLADEHYALKSGKLFNGIKIALACIPLVGTAVSLADASSSLYQAVAAFRRGDIAHGIDQLASVFECLVYAVMDVVTFAALPATRAHTARQLTATRQLKHTAGPSFWRLLKLRQGDAPRQRFAGYEHPHTLAAGSLQPVQTGPYRHTLRHRSGEHFILSDGHYFKVRFDPTTHEMRLVASGKSYAPAIALDQALQWDTYAALHGGRLTGYSGGSRRQQRGSRRAGAQVPSAVQQQTPPAAAQVHGQRKATLEAIQKLSDEFDTQLVVTNREVQALEHRFDTSIDAPGATQRIQATTTLDTLLAAEIDRGKRLYALNQTAAGFAGSTLRQDIAFNQSRQAMVLADRYMRLGLNSNRRIADIQNRIQAITKTRNALQAFSPEDLSAQTALKQCRIEMLEEWNRISIALKEMNTWFQRITDSSMEAKVSADISLLRTTFTEHRVLALKTGQLLQAIRAPYQPGISWIYQEMILQRAVEKLDRTLAAHLELPETSISKVQRNQMLRNTLDAYEQFHRDLTAWNALSPSHFDAVYMPQLLDTLTQLMERARRGIKRTHTPQTQATKTTFETEDGQLLIGTQQLAQQQSPRRYIVTDRAGNTVEVWDQVSDSQKYRLNIAQSQPVATPPPLPSDLASVVSEARTRLAGVEAIENTVRSYKTMEPINLEHMLFSEAQALERRAQHVQSLDANHPLIEQLRTRATPLKATGTALRIERTLASKTPTEGYLDFLMEHQRVAIRKLGTRRALKHKRPDGETDYLQEYAIYDRQQGPDTPLWYAHFHYIAADSAFDTFAKAHLKTVEQQYQGLHWQIAADGRGVGFADLKIWRGNIEKPLANLHFKDVV